MDSMQVKFDHKQAPGPIPAGKYLAVITESEMNPTSQGQATLLQLTFQIIEGEYQNRLLWARLNLDNPNAVAVQIARADYRLFAERWESSHRMTRQNYITCR